MKLVNILFSDRVGTQFAQDADLFENSKVLIRAIVAKVVDDFGASHIEAIERKCEDSPYSLVAIYDWNIVYYRNPDVRVISTGSKWAVLDDLLPN